MQRKIVTKTKLQNCCACHAICDKNKNVYLSIKKERFYQKCNNYSIRKYNKRKKSILDVNQYFIKKYIYIYIINFG